MSESDAKRWLRLFDLAMQVEGIPPEKRERVQHWLLYGSSPDRDLSEMTTELLPAEVRFNHDPRAPRMQLPPPFEPDPTLFKEDRWRGC